MPFLTNLQEKDVVDKLTDDESALKKIFRRKKLTYHSKTAPVDSYDEHAKKGWDISQICTGVGNQFFVIFKGKG